MLIMLCLFGNNQRIKIKKWKANQTITFQHDSSMKLRLDLQRHKENHPRRPPQPRFDTRMLELLQPTIGWSEDRTVRWNSSMTCRRGLQQHTTDH